MLGIAIWIRLKSLPIRFLDPMLRLRHCPKWACNQPEIPRNPTKSHYVSVMIPDNFDFRMQEVAG